MSVQTFSELINSPGQLFLLAIAGSLFAVAVFLIRRSYADRASTPRVSRIEEDACCFLFLNGRFERASEEGRLFLAAHGLEDNPLRALAKVIGSEFQPQKEKIFELIEQGTPFEPVLLDAANGQAVLQGLNFGPFAALRVQFLNAEVEQVVAEPEEAKRADHAELAFLKGLMSKIETGCVVFDENAQLVYHNPAFLTLFPVKEEWCASKPTLTEILYELRNLGMLPEKRDFATFRSNLTGHLEPGEVPYREEWVLPTGQTLKVEGQQLPGNYVALTFQDLTELKTTEARFHTERADGRTILDQFEQPVACFDPCGDMTAANRAFQRLWKLDQRPETPFTIKDLASRGEAATGVSPVWGNLRNFATGTLQRSKTRSEIATEMDVTMTCQYAPLPSQGTVVSFHTSMAKDPATRVSETAVRASDLVTDLETLSTKRGIGLILEGWDNGPEIECGTLALKRLMSALIVALSPSPRKGAEIWISLDANEGGVQFTITQSAPGIYPDLSESVAGRLAMRLAKEFGARLEAKDGELHLWLPKAEENPPQEETGTTGAA